MKDLAKSVQRREADSTAGVKDTLSKSSGGKNVTMYIPADVIKQVKFAALEEERSVSSITTELLKQWLAERESQ